MMKRYTIYIIALFATLMVTNNVCGITIPTSGALTGTYTLTNNVTLTGTLTVADKSEVTINLSNFTIDGNSHQIFNVKEGGKLTIQGVGTIKNGKANNGGCAYISGSVIIYNTVISDCTSDNDGGAFYVAATGSLSITNGELKNNSATRLGGAICSATTANNLSIIGKTKLSYNSAKENGGAIYARTLIIKGNSITEPVTIECNEATAFGLDSPFTGNTNNNKGRGGGIYIPTSSNDKEPFGEMECDIEYCHILNNYAAIDGGGIYSGINTTVGNSKIVGNKAMSSEKRGYPALVNAGRGGGFYFVGYYRAASGSDTELERKSQFTLNNTEVLNNAAMYYGGGGQLGTRAILTINGTSKINGNTAVLHGAGGLHLTANVTLNLNAGEINNNHAYTVGGGIHTSYGCTLNLKGGTISNNEAYQRGGGVHVNTGGSLVLGGTNITGNRVYKGKDMGYATVVKDTEGIYTWDSNSLDYKKVSESSYKYEDNDDSKYLVNTGLGGGVLIDSGSCIMNSGDLSENYAQVAGGGLCLVMIRLSDKKSDFETLNVVNFTFNNGSISKNKTDGNGAGVYIMKNNILSMLKELFSDNIPDEIKNSSKYSQLTTGKPFSNIVNGTFLENEANEYGGAIYMEEGDLSVDANGYTNLTKNVANNHHGGAIYLGKGTVTVNGTILVESNKATNGNGGGIYCAGTFTVEGKAVVSSNTAKNGGGLCVENGSVTLPTGNSCVINNNVATNLGGGLYVVNDDDETTPEVSFNGGTFTGNTAQSGGAVCASGQMSLSLGATMEDNTATNGNGGAIYMANGVDMTFGEGLIRANKAIGTLITSGGTAYHKDASNVAGVGGGIFMANNTSLEFNSQELGIYNNSATNAGADICANGNGTSITLPDVTNMNLKGFDVPGNDLYWIQDYFTGETTNITEQGIRYEDALKIANHDFAAYKVQTGTYTNYLCLDLGYELIFLKLQTLGLSGDDDVAIIMEYPKPIEDADLKVTYENTMYRKVWFKGNQTKTVAIPAGFWQLSATEWSYKYKDDIQFSPAHVENSTYGGSYINIVRGKINDVVTDPLITITFIPKENVGTEEPGKKFVKEFQSRVVNRMGTL